MSELFRQSQPHLSVLIVKVALVAGVFAMGELAGAPAGQASLHASIPPWANAANYSAAADTTESIGFRVYLEWNNPAAVAALAQAVSDPRSSSYRNYMTAAQFRHQFAPSQAQ